MKNAPGAGRCGAGRRTTPPPSGQSRAPPGRNDRLVGIVGAAEIEWLDPSARRRLDQSLGDVWLLHESEALLEASNAFGDRGDDEPIVFGRPRRLGHVGRDQRNPLVQDVDVVRQSQRYALGHAPENDRGSAGMPSGESVAEADDETNPAKAPRRQTDPVLPTIIEGEPQ